MMQRHARYSINSKKKKKKLHTHTQNRTERVKVLFLLIALNLISFLKRETHLGKREYCLHPETSTSESVYFKNIKGLVVSFLTSIVKPLDYHQIFNLFFFLV